MVAQGLLGELLGEELLFQVALLVLKSLRSGAVHLSPFLFVPAEVELFPCCGGGDSI